MKIMSFNTQHCLNYITQEIDFNVEPDSKLLLPIRSILKDTASLFNEEKLSFPSDKPDRKIDYIFVSQDVEIVSADIPRIVASDHRPHLAEVKD